jgi:cytoskeletal protein RodZ
MKLEAQRPGLARVLVSAVLGAVGLMVAPAVALGAGPERAPVKAPSRLGPEPSPAAHATTTSTATTSTNTSSSTTSTSQVSSAATSRPVVASTASAPPQQRPATSARPKANARPPDPPRATHKVKTAVKSLSHAFQRPAARFALAAGPAGSSDSNRLLFIGGLALLVLVLGDATFLAVSARVIREQR